MEALLDAAIARIGGFRISAKAVCQHSRANRVSGVGATSATDVPTFAFTGVATRCRYAIFYAAREEPDESESITPQPCWSRHIFAPKRPGCRRSLCLWCFGAARAISRFGFASAPHRCNVPWRQPSVSSGVEINRARGGFNKCNQDSCHELSAPAIRIRLTFGNIDAEREHLVNRRA
jgi:hypothetical protein